MILSFFRTVILYLVLIAAMRALGKRQIGQLEPSEFVVALLIADLASIPMENSGIPLLSGLVPILTVLGLELVLSGFALGSVKFRRLLCGKPVILIENGKLIQENLRRTRITLDELTSHLRQKDVLDIEKVQLAIRETDGNLAVSPFPRDAPATAGDAGIRVQKQYVPMTIIEDGFLSWDNLQKAGKNEKWLNTELKKHRADVPGTFLLTLDGAGHVHWVGKEKKV
jgi:uncharacterized membrane protein YcaP (DUF421 family)